MADFDRVRWHVVSGKGGTGKTTVAAALALAIAMGGRRVLLVEVEGRQGIAQVFDTPPLPYEERRLTLTPAGGEVRGLAINTHEAVYEYLDMYYRLGRAGRALDKLGAIEFATTIAPGMRDVLLTGKTYEAVRRRSDEGYVYDAVVMDAPPTGRITRFLNVNEEVAGLAKMGPIHRQSKSIMASLRRFGAVHLVTSLEEMPVQETLDAVAELRAANLPIGGVVVNSVAPSLLDDKQLAAAHSGQLSHDALSSGLQAAGLPHDGPVVATLEALARDHAEQDILERQGRALLATVGRPTYELPRLADSIDLGSLHELADDLRRQGAV